MIVSVPNLGCQPNFSENTHQVLEACQCLCLGCGILLSAGTWWAARPSHMRHGICRQPHNPHQNWYAAHPHEAACSAGGARHLRYVGAARCNRLMRLRVGDSVFRHAGVPDVVLSKLGQRLAKPSSYSRSIRKEGLFRYNGILYYMLPMR